MFLSRLNYCSCGPFALHTIILFILKTYFFNNLIIFDGDGDFIESKQTIHGRKNLIINELLVSLTTEIPNNGPIPHFTAGLCEFHFYR